MARTGLIFRMENDGGSATAESAEEVLAVEAEASNATDEVEAASGDVTEVETGIENAGEAQAELSSIEASVEEAAEDGGMTPREAEHVQARLERVAALLGTTVADMGLTFRKESFGGASSRVAATKMRLEGIKEWGKKIWEAIKKAWAWLKDAVSNFFAKLTGNIEAVEKRLKELQGRVNSAATKNMKSNKSTVGYAAKVFTIEGKSGYDEMLKMLSNGRVYFEILDILAGETNKSSSTTPVDKKLVEDYAKRLKEIFTTNGVKATNLPKSAEKDAEGGILLPNGEAVLAVPKNETVTGGEDLAIFYLTVGDAHEKKADDYTALTFDQMKKVLEAALDLAKLLKNAKKVETEFRATIDNNIKHCENQMKIAGSGNAKDKDEANQEKVKKILEMSRIANNLNISLVKMGLNRLPKAAFDLCAAAGDAVNGNLGNYKEEEK